jgi:hypothetical protein
VLRSAADGILPARPTSAARQVQIIIITVVNHVLQATMGIFLLRQTQPFLTRQAVYVALVKPPVIMVMVPVTPERLDFGILQQDFVFVRLMKLEAIHIVALHLFLFGRFTTL